MEKSYWRKGKIDNTKFLNIKLSRSTNFKTYLFGLFFTAIIILPLALILFQVIEIYWFKFNTRFLFLSISWGLLLICNGLSNYLTIKLAKSYNPDMDNLQAIDENAVFLYQVLNPGFALFTLAIMIYFGVSSL